MDEFGREKEPLDVWQALGGSDGGGLAAVWLTGCKAAFQRMIAEKQGLAAAEYKTQVPPLV